MSASLFIASGLDWRLLLQQGVALLMPEVLLTAFACFVLVLESTVKAEQRRWSAYASLGGIAASAVSLVQMYVQFKDTRVTGFYEMYVIDPFALAFKGIFLLTAGMAVVLSIQFLDVEHEQRGEYYALILFATTGMMFMASGADLLSIFISFELSAVAVYVLVAYFKADRKSNEASMKYFLLGVFASGLFLYGISLIYGLTGETNLSRIAAALATTQDIQSFGFLAFFGMALIACGLFFKVAAAPFHMWCPDAYEGAPSAVTAFMSVGAKAAAFAIFVRIFAAGLGALRGAPTEGGMGWAVLVAVVAALTMTWGNLAALTQSNAKRLMAYSSISHAGFLLLGLVAGNATGYQGMIVYLLVYVFMNLGAWGVLIALRRGKIAGDQVDSFNGLMRTHPVMAVMMTVFMLSLAGIPPTAGFIGKYLLFAGLIETGERWWTILAVVAVLNTVISLYYYARFIKAMFTAEATEREPLAASRGMRAALIVATIMVGIIGIYPAPFLKYARVAASGLSSAVSSPLVTIK
ncbi:MAG: NADH-quinone oxidoreductase subunit N [Acidobacteria bacterium]|nr:NADH-quinone oxidoreductase subunit N [Acidobacteriota bacterium]